MSKTINELELATNLDAANDMTLVYDVSEAKTKKANLNQFVSSHTHEISAINGLQDVLDTKVGASHSHVISDVVGLSSALSAKADQVHNHGMSSIIGLEDALNSKANTSHTHTASNITDFNEAAQDAVGAMVNSTLTYNDASNSLGVTDNTSTQRVQVSKGGTLVSTRKNINLIEGTHVTLTVADDVANDRVNVTIDSAGGGGGGTTDWGEIGGTLSAQTDLQTALDGKANTSHTHTISNITNLQTSLDAKYNASNVTAFGGTLVGSANNTAARSTLGLGTAATLNVGTSANNIVQLDGSARLPAVDGSQLTNLPSSGVNVVKRIKQVVKSDTWGGSTANSWMDVTGLSISVTPQSASHKILVQADLSIQYTTTTALNGARSNVGVRLVRDTTDIGLGDTRGSNIRATKNVGLENNEIENVSLMFIDSPNTTSPVTYKVQVFVPNTLSAVLRVNFTGASTGSTSEVVGISTITITEFEDV